MDTSSAYGDMQMVESSNLTKVVDQIDPIMTDTGFEIIYGMHIFLNIVFSLEGGPRYKPPGVSR